MRGATTLTLFIVAYSKALLTLSTNSFVLSGKVSPSSLLKPTIISPPPRASRREAAILIKTKFLAGTHTLLAVSLALSITSNSLAETLGTFPSTNALPESLENSLRKLTLIIFKGILSSFEKNSATLFITLSSLLP
ncbi:135aa long hypothetical protein [Pyrococcus horikoshii OT3]|uniref:Uncharacterized protein n=1 Tax=Pyrococcus horikoshii (strain ATCC 700860 / DSM 12428 / JCM 9974 / NBRC 100139 / OT-3) TaxID=70601 RepID=O57837_PYRHO|nr:135aa long hypothetical protein [Pyrococcus horikoshii OT3]